MSDQTGPDVSLETLLAGPKVLTVVYTFEAGGEKTTFETTVNDPDPEDFRKVLDIFTHALDGEGVEP